MANINIQKVLSLHKAESLKTPKIQGDYLISSKIDGWYCYIDYDVITNSWYIPCSSRLREIPAFRWSRRVFDSLPSPKESCRFIMEATIPGMDFHTMNGLFNRSKGECSCHDVVFHIHDYIPLRTYFDRTEVRNTALERYKTLQHLDVSNTNGTIRIHPILGVSPAKEIWMYYFDEVVSKGGEGVVLKRAESLYTPGKRNSDLMKIKEEITLDLLCTRAYRTVGEKGHDNINLVFTRKNGAEITVRLGKDKDVALFEEADTNFVGRIGEVKAMEELENGALREPRFLRIRNDKVEGE